MESPANFGPRFEVSTSDPCLFSVFGEPGGDVGGSAKHTDDVSGCVEPDLLMEVRTFPEPRFGQPEVQEKSSLHVGMVLAQEGDFSAALTQVDFSGNLKFFPTRPKLRAGRQGPYPQDETRMRRRKLGQLRRMAAVSRPDVCARSAKPASRIESLRGSGVIESMIRPEQ